MSRIGSRWTWGVFVALAMTGCGGGGARSSPPSAPVRGEPLRVAADTGGADAPAAANPGGRYQHLLTVVRAPEDEATYGAVRDYGLWGPGEWAGAMRPKGYWVYVAPSWYVWESEGAASAKTAQSPEARAELSSAHGKYAELIKTLDVPQDRETYGDFDDYGAWGPGDYAGAPQPAGFWVYVAPTWYVWRVQR